MPMKSDKAIMDMYWGDSTSSNDGVGWFKQAQQSQNTQHQLAKEWMGVYNGDRNWYSPGVDGTNGGVVICRIQPVVNGMVGFMRQMSVQPDYQARIEDEQEQIMVSEAVNGGSEYYRDRMSADQIESQQNAEMLICGYGVVDTGISTVAYGITRTPSGDTIMGNICPWHVNWDPLATGPNLLDARWVSYRRKFQRKDAMKLFGVDEDAFGGEYESESNKDWKPYPGGRVDRVALLPKESFDNDIVEVTYLQWWDPEPFWRLKNPAFALQQYDPALAQYILDQLASFKRAQLAERDRLEQPDVFDFDPNAEMLVMDQAIYEEVKAAFEEIGSVFRMYGIEIEFIKETRRVYYTAILTPQEVFNKFKSLDQNGFTLKFKTANYDPNRNLWTGIVAFLREPDLYSNKMLTEMLRIISANSKGGVMYETGAVPDPQKFEKQYARTFAAIEVNPGGLDKIREKSLPVLPNGYDNLYPQFVDAFNALTPVDKATLLQGNDRAENAQLHRQRMRYVYTTMATYFDASTLYTKEQGKLMLTYMRVLAENDPNRLYSFMNEDGKKIFRRIPITHFMNDFDLVVAESPDKPAQQEEAALYLDGLGKAILQVNPPAGMQVLAIAAQYAKQFGIKQRDADKLISVLAPEPTPPTQEQIQEQQLKMAAAEAEIRNKNADAAYKEAGISERKANAMHTFSEAQQKHMENEALAKIPPSQYNVTI